MGSHGSRVTVTAVPPAVKKSGLPVEKKSRSSTAQAFPKNRTGDLFFKFPVAIATVGPAAPISYEPKARPETILTKKQRCDGSLFIFSQLESKSKARNQILGLDPRRIRPASAAPNFRLAHSCSLLLFHSTYLI